MNPMSLRLSPSQFSFRNNFHSEPPTVMDILIQINLRLPARFAQTKLHLKILFHAIKARFQQPSGDRLRVSPRKHPDSFQINRPIRVKEHPIVLVHLIGPHRVPLISPPNPRLLQIIASAERVLPDLVQIFPNSPEFG